MGSGIHRIHIGEEERASGQLSNAQLAEALAALDRDGIVVLHNAIRSQTVEKLAAKVLADFQEVSNRRPLNSKYLAPPRDHPWLLEEVLYNPFAIRILLGLLGSGFYWDNYAQNAVEPHSGGRQGLHADHLPVFPSEELHDHPHAATMAVVNVPLCEFTADNGATEVWLGSHRETRSTGTAVSEEIQAERRHAGDRVVQMTAPKVALMQCLPVYVYDWARMFHGAMPNKTDQYRSMVGMVYSRAFMRPFNERKGLGKGPFMPFAKGTESFFEHPEVEAHCVFVNRTDLGPDFMHGREQLGEEPMTPFVDHIGVVKGGPLSRL